MGFTVNDKVTLPAEFDKSGTVKPDGTVTGTVVLVDDVRGYGVLVAVDPAFLTASATGPEWIDGESDTPYDWSFTSDGKYVSDGTVVLALAE